MEEETKAPETQEPEVQTGAPAAENAGGDEQQQQPTGKYTDDDVNSIVLKKESKILKKLGVESLDDAVASIAEYRKFKESQETEEEKANREKGALEREKERADNAEMELASYKERDKVLQAGVSKEFQSFVAFEAKKLVTDDVDFDAALKKFLTEHPAYTAPADTMRPTVTTGTTTTGITVNELQAIKDKKYGNNPYYKK